MAAQEWAPKDNRKVAAWAETNVQIFTARALTRCNRALLAVFPTRQPHSAPYNKCVVDERLVV